LARCSASRIDVEVELRECFDTFTENKNIDLVFAAHNFRSHFAISAKRSHDLRKNDVRVMQRPRTLFDTKKREHAQYPPCEMRFVAGINSGAKTGVAVCPGCLHPRFVLTKTGEVHSAE